MDTRRQTRSSIDETGVQLDQRSSVADFFPCCFRRINTADSDYRQAPIQTSGDVGNHCGRARPQRCSG